MAKMALRWTLLAALVAASVAPSVLAQKGRGSSVQPAEATVPFARAAECVGLYRFMAGMVPAEAPQRAQIDMREASWMTYTAGIAPGGRAGADEAANRFAASLRDKVVAAQGDEAKLALVMGPLNELCQNAPSAAVVAQAPPAPKAPVISESTIRTSEGLMRCAGLTKYHEERGVGVSATIGTTALFRRVAIEQRPDLSEAEIDRRIEQGKAGFAKMMDDAVDIYSAALMEGRRDVNPVTPEISELNENCSIAANFHERRLRGQ